MANWSLYEQKMRIDGNSMREKQINDMLYAILNDFQNSPSYRQTHINGSRDLKEIHVIETQYPFAKSVLMKPGDRLYAGDILEFDHQKWLCVTVNRTNVIYDVGTVYLCNNVLKLYKNNTLYEIPCVIDSNVRLYSMGYDDGKYFPMPDSSIIVRIPNNSITKDISRNQIFNISDESYKIVDINKVIEDGIIVIKMEYSLEKQEIPVEEDPLPSPQPSGLIAKIIDPIDSIIKNKSASYVGKFYDNDNKEIDTELAVFYLTDDDGQPTSLATITEQSGDGFCTVLARNELGYVKLWMKNADESIVSEPVRIRIRNIF